MLSVPKEHVPTPYNNKTVKVLPESSLFLNSRGHFTFWKQPH